MVPLDLIDALRVAGVGLSALALFTSALIRSLRPAVQLERDALDPFDVVDVQDTPVDEARFRREARLRKLVIVACLLGVVACQWPARDAPQLFAAYMVLLALLPVHSTSILHLSLLGLLASWVECTLLLVPSVPSTPRLETVAALYSVSAAIALTTPFGPPLHHRRDNDSQFGEANVAQNANGSIANIWLFMFATKILSLARRPDFAIKHLPVLQASMRATQNYNAIHRFDDPRTRLHLLGRLLRINASGVSALLALSFVISFAYYAPPFFLKKLLEYLEADPTRHDTSWAWVWVAGFFVAHFVLSLLMGQLVFVSKALQTRIQVHLNSLLFAKTLVRKDITAASQDDRDDNSTTNSKAGIIALMSSDVDQVGALADSIYDIADTPFEILVGVFFLYQLLGTSALVGLGVTLVCLPLHQRSGGIVTVAQRSLAKARDERVSLTNEMLGAIRMLKFMAWERNFESRLLQLREKELSYQKISFTIEAIWTALGNSVPIIFALVSFWHFTVIAGNALTPAIAFTALSIFTELQYSIKGIPASLIRLIQGFVSLGRISHYLKGPEVAPVLPLTQQPRRLAFESVSVTWPQATTAQSPFTMRDLSLEFPAGQLTLVCGRFGSGKTLLLLALLGEADVLAGQIICPRSPPNALLSNPKDSEAWIVDGLCAYVPQTAWLRNQSIKENILFNLPYDETRYRETLFACALEADLRLLDDGDDTEIGERGINLSGGQKQRVSLARAVYSRASILLLDDILSAVDSHTAQHIHAQCLDGPLLRGRTVILVSHHVQLCAAYIVALDNGRVQFQGTADAFKGSTMYGTLVQTSGQQTPTNGPSLTEKLDVEVEELPVQPDESTAPAATKKKPRKLVKEEERLVGHVDFGIWTAYFHSWGTRTQWIVLVLVLLAAAGSPVLENGWLRIWAGSSEAESSSARGPLFYVGVYAALTLGGLAVKTLRWYILYSGSIQASRKLFQGLLHSILLANIRFHDTISRGLLLNRFGRDLEGIDRRISATIGHCVIAFISTWITFVVISVVGGPIFCLAAFVLGVVFFRYGRVRVLMHQPKHNSHLNPQMFSNASREMRRLASVSSSPLHSLYWETVSGIAVLRAFGGSTQFLLDMLALLDINTAPKYWSLATSQWLSFRANALTTVLVGLVAVMAVMFPHIDAALAGFTVMFAQNMAHDFQNMAHRFSGLEQDLVAMERIREFSEIEPEEDEDDDERAMPPSGWPHEGRIEVESLGVRYAEDLPPVLHDLSFTIRPGEKIGIIGRTGSGKTTLGLSFLRFVPSSLTTGRILIDGVDIGSIGLRDLRRGLTIIPQDPTILSGTIRSTVDPEDEYSDAEIFTALRRVHLPHTSLDAHVAEGGENFSAGEKQLLCMARAILKQSKVLIMDEATASVDFSTDELITQSVREAFASSTVLTIAHRLSTIVAYDRVMVLHEGRIAELDSPRTLLADPESAFHGMCAAMGEEELEMLKRLAEGNVVVQ
uniref:Multidrug resistance-associated ABC transporter protein n=1 Tax=Mycena chlorophos TaxID=658473 RepID=A0ABQ0LUN5_MYCCL|nr:multidrug resistance-associated ABC transporter protein [Mycena chlorophos]